jgi:3-hydroxyisobutyrate dehydrogenase-like beta-hydroxyacid dehydrogenase
MTETPMRVGFCGLGIMGSRMAANLVRAGHDVAVWNRTMATAEAWVAEHGGRLARTPAEAADGAQVLITMLVDGEQVAAVLEGITEPVCVDMSTIGAPAARALAQGRRFVDAPVTGSSPKAQDGTLTIMAGGSDEDVAFVMPLLEAMGAKIVHAGPVGDGQAIKVITNALGAANAAALAQALVVAAACELDLGAVIEVLPLSAAGSVQAQTKAQLMVDHDYTPMFRLGHMLKDVRLALEQAHEAQVPFLAAAEAGQLLEAARAQGHADADLAAVIEVVEGLAGRPNVSP